MKTTEPARKVVVIGAGPAGLTAAHDLARRGVATVVLEKAPIVGGIARTESYKDFLFDMGGHRFFTKSKEVNEKWREILGEDFLRRPRLSRIYYKKRFFNYPLKPFNALQGLGLGESVAIVLSYLRWQLFPYRREDTFEQWVTNRFGRRLFRIFFKSYTEKVWGIPCSELRAEWAAQRIKDLSLTSAILSMFFEPKRKITTLIEEFHYPRRGPGMLWTVAKDQIDDSGGTVRMNSDVVEVRRDGNRIRSVVVGHNGTREEIEGTDFISSMPITEFVRKLSAPPEVLAAAAGLRYRDFLTVCLIVDVAELFPDNWIYIHDQGVKVGRIQNYKNWSPEMVPDPEKSSLGLEYFCDEGDELWNLSDTELIELGKREVEELGFARAADVEDGCVFRVPKSYPVYDGSYRDHLMVVREFVDALENFQTIGRNGLHRYNNQDHAMVTGMLAVRNILDGERHDLWSVNTEREFHEEIVDAEATGDDAVAETVRAALRETFQKLDPVAFGLSLGTVAGALLFAATLALVLKGGDHIGPNLGLLGQYFPGYRVSAAGSLAGLAYGFLAGCVGGWSFAFLRNATVLLFLGAVRRQAERSLIQKLLKAI